ncbi:hypothetical protein H1R20_g10032, partial [Candolleomyces eurysporus]
MAGIVNCSESFGLPFTSPAGSLSETPDPQPASQPPIRHGVFAAKPALEHLGLCRDELVQAVNGFKSPITVLAGFNKDIFERSTSLLQEIHIYPMEELELEQPALEQVGKLAAPYPSVIFLPSGKAVRPPVYDAEGNCITFDRVIASSVCNLRFSNAIEKGLLISSIPEGEPNGENQNRDGVQGTGAASIGAAGQLPTLGGSDAQQISDSNGLGPARGVSGVEGGEEDSGSGAVPEGADGDIEAGESALGLRNAAAVPQDPPEPEEGGLTGEPSDVQFQGMAVIHQPDLPPMGLQLQGTLSYQYIPQQSAMVKFSRMRSQASQTDENTLSPYSQKFIKIMVDTADPLWGVVEIQPRTMASSESQEKRASEKKTTLQTAIKILMTFNPFKAGANFEGAHTKKQSTTAERVFFRDRVFLEEGRGSFAWIYHIDDEDAKERGFELPPHYLPTVELEYFPYGHVSPEKLSVEVSSFWSLVPDQTGNKVLDAARPTPLGYSNLCQDIWFDLAQEK